MTLLAVQLSVLPFEDETSESAVLKFLRVQSCERELPPVVFQVTTCAIGLSGGNVICAGVVAGVFLNTPANFAMAIQAFQAACTEAEIVTRRAFGCALQGLVSLRERAGRYLGKRGDE